MIFFSIENEANKINNETIRSDLNSLSNDNMDKNKADEIKKETIKPELNNLPINNIHENKTKWKDHVHRMLENRLPKLKLNYRPRMRDFINDDLMVDNIT